MSTTRMHELWKQLKFSSDMTGLSEETSRSILPVLEGELKAREIKRMKHLLHRSGIKRIKRLEDFDWKFNPKIPRQEIMALAGTA